MNGTSSGGQAAAGTTRSDLRSGRLTSTGSKRQVPARTSTWAEATTPGEAGGTGPAPPSSGVPPPAEDGSTMGAPLPAAMAIMHTELVPFHGSVLEAGKAGKVWVVVRRMCEAIEIDYSGQHQRLSRPARCPWATVGVMPMVHRPRACPPSYGRLRHLDRDVCAAVLVERQRARWENQRARLPRCEQGTSCCRRSE